MDSGWLFLQRFGGKLFNMSDLGIQFGGSDIRERHSSLTRLVIKLSAGAVKTEKGVARVLLGLALVFFLSSGLLLWNEFSFRAAKKEPFPLRLMGSPQFRR